MKMCKKILLAIIAIVVIVCASTMTVSAATTDELMMKVEATEWTQVYYDFVPQLNQRAYNKAYGNHGTISSHGCGLVCLSMVASYMNDTYYEPEKLAEIFGDYNTVKGSKWSLFKDSAEVFGLELIESNAHNGEWYSWSKVKRALENEQLVVCLQSKGMFTGSGHFIVLTGISSNGKILVNDPNGYNWTKNRTLRNGYKNGFTASQIKENAVAYWIYGNKAPSDMEFYACDCC